MLKIKSRHSDSLSFWPSAVQFSIRETSAPVPALDTTLVISEDGAIVENGEVLEGAPSVSISGADVRFSNLDGGRIISLSSNAAAIAIEGAGAIVTNEAGGVISARLVGDAALVGSIFADVIVNAGAIYGEVRLGEGADRFVQLTRVGSNAGLNDKVYLGTGDDIFQLGDAAFLELGPSLQLQTVEGGAGFDTMILEGVIGQAIGNRTFSFEKLVVGAGVTGITAFSHYQQIALEAGGDYQFADSFNPLVDLTMIGGSIYVLAGSGFRSIQGSDVSERVEFDSSGTVSSDVSLGGGDDHLVISASSGSGSPALGLVDGGSGNDQIDIQTLSGQTVDLGHFSNFEILNVGLNIGVPVSAQLMRVDEVTQIWTGFDSQVSILESDLSTATLRPGARSTLFISEDTTLWRTGFFDGPPFEDPATIIRERPDAWVQVINDGLILDDVRFSAGDDLYDGRVGLTEGTVFGFAGDDQFYGSARADRFDGGRGADVFQGGGGNDVIDGGAGFDTAVFGGLRRNYTVELLDDGVLRLTGDDQVVHMWGVDRLQFDDGYYMPTGYFDDPSLALGAFGFSAGGWTGNDSYPRAAADVNGDGRADLIGFGDSGVQVALAIEGGGFAAPYVALTSFGVSAVAGGWTSDDLYPRMAADVNGDGKADLIGFGDGGVWRAEALDDGSFAPPVQSYFGLGSLAFGASERAGGWTSNDKYPRLAADVNGDGGADLIGFGDGGVWIALAAGSGWQVPQLALGAFGFSAAAGGWTSNDKYPRLAADVNGDDSADLIGFGDGGVQVALAIGNGAFADPVMALTTFGTSVAAGGWTSDDRYHRTAADVTGDGLADLIGFGDGGVYLAVALGDGRFSDPVLTLSAFGAGAGGWSSEDRFPRVLADMDGNGTADLVGFGDGGVQIALAGYEWAI